MSKLLIFKSESESAWGSCKTISKNLIQSYLELGNEFEISWCPLSESLEDYLVHSKASLSLAIQKIRAKEFDKIIFIDHLPLPMSFIEYLYLECKELPEIVIHVYGDFTFFAEAWYNFFKKTSGELKISLVAASLAQKKMLEFLFDGSIQVSQAIFPISENFYFSAELREKGREKLKLNMDDELLIYTGRISLQKNVHVLIEQFLNFISKNKITNKYFYIAGHFDGISSGDMRIQTYEGYLFAKIEKIISKFPLEYSCKVTLAGALNSEELFELYNAGDCYVSLSLFHDEDYGMAPAEALACGQDVIMTDWGGYSSFRSNSSEKQWNVDFLSVAVGDLCHEIDLVPFYERLLKNNYKSYEARERESLNFKESFSISACRKMIKNIAEAKGPSTGITFNNLRQYIQLAKFSLEKEGVNLSFLPIKNTFYSLMYGNYMNNGKLENEK